MKSLEPSFLAALTYSGSDLKTLQSLGESRGKQQLYIRQRPQTLESLQRGALIESTDASNRLEGITAPPARLKALVERTIEPHSRSEQEIAGYREALELIHQSGAEIPITTNVIRQLHQWIHRYVPEGGGHWKTTDNEIVEKDEKGNIVRVRFKAVSAVSTPQAMDTLIAGYGKAHADEREPLLLIPLFVLDFLCIHPFRDGNGRVGRLLTLLLLYRAGYEVGRYISLERLYEQSQQSYYETLEASSQGWHEGRHDVMPWLRYFWGVLIKAYKEFEERVGTLEIARGSKSQRVRDAVHRKVVPFGITEIEREVPGVSRETIRLVLREMKSEGSLISEGRGRGARWKKSTASRS
jgi:Fic family protein